MHYREGSRDQRLKFLTLASYIKYLSVIYELKILLYLKDNL
jgi:hypothetical protein